MYPFVVFRYDRARFLLRRRNLGDNFGFSQNLAHLPLGQLAPSAGLQVVEEDRADARPHQPHDRMADGFHHAADLPIAPFVNRQLDNPASLGSAASEFLHFGRRRDFTPTDIQPARQCLQGGVRRHPLNGYQVRLAHVPRRMRYLVNKIAVVRQEHQPFGIGIQSPGRNHANIGDLDEVRHLPRRVSVGDRGDVSFGFVQGDVKTRLIHEDRFTIDDNLLCLRIDEGSRLRDNYPIDLDPTRGD